MFEGMMMMMMMMLTICSDVLHVTDQSHTHLVYLGHI